MLCVRSRPMVTEGKSQDSPRSPERMLSSNDRPQPGLDPGSRAERGHVPRHSPGGEGLWESEVLLEEGRAGPEGAMLCGVAVNRWSRHHFSFIFLTSYQEENVP